MAKAVVLGAPPIKTPMIDESRMITPEWAKWVQQLHDRSGGTVAISNVNLSNVKTISTLFTNYANATNTSLYTSPTGLSTAIDTFTAQNRTGVDQTISVYLVPAGTSASSANIAVSNFVVPAGETKTLDQVIGQVIGSGAAIVVSASAPTALIVSASGRQVS